MLGDKDGYLALGLALGFMGALVLFIWFNGLAGLEYCELGEYHGACLREWIGALSGWGATAAAAITVYFLIGQTRAASRSAELASTAIQEARYSSERQLRAYVTVGEIHSDSLQGDDVRVRINFRNSGQTPAYGTFVRYRTKITSRADTDFDLPMTGSQFAELGPDQEVGVMFTLDSKLLDDNWEAIEQRSKRLFCWGDLSYTDAFDQARKHSFRFEYEPDVGNGNPRFVMSATGNLIG